MPVWSRMRYGALVLILAAAPLAAQDVGNNPVLLEVLSRLEQLEQEMRQMRGQLEEQQFTLDRQAQRIEDLETALAGGVTPTMPLTGSTDAQGQPPGIDASQVPQPPLAGTSSPPTLPPGAASDQGGPVVSTTPQISSGSTPTPPPTAPAPSTVGEQAAYDAAFGRLRTGQFDEAATAFSAFVRQYPDSELTGNALYWLGESAYVNSNFDQARDAFVQLGSNHSQHPRLPDAMLKLGYIYERQGDAARSREVLRKLVDTYPDTPAATEAKGYLQ